MPYEDEDPPYVEPDAALTEITGAIIGAAIEVHRQLSAGLDESFVLRDGIKRVIRPG